MQKNLTLPLAAFFLIGLFVLSPLKTARAQSSVSPPKQDAPAPTAEEIINAVNDLRIKNGLAALRTNAILTAVAQDQAYALASTEGAVGHERQCGMTLGQDLLSRGYPLLGDLSLDGYRSENWVQADTTEQAISFWLGDDPHTNTMLSPNRNDIGAAVAGTGPYYVVLETAWSTSSGNMQYDAYAILTGMPMTQSACLVEATQYAENSNLPQNSVPVVKSTPLPDGDVIHEVKYGQTLWSIAIQYGTTIAEIRRLNHLTNDVIQPAQKLLVRQNASQLDNLTPTFSVTTTLLPWEIPAASASATPSATATPAPPLSIRREDGIVIVVILVSFASLIASLGFWRKKPC